MPSFDFYSQFSGYPTVDLLKIIREKDGYQPEAVLAAERILQEREVSSADEEDADRYFQEKETVRMAAAAKIGAIKAAAADWVEPLARPTTEFHPYKWFRIFLVVFGISYLWELYSFIRLMIQTWGLLGELGSNCIYGAGLMLETIVFVLLLMRHRWGWILLVVQYAAAILIELFSIVSLWRFRRIGYSPMPTLGVVLFYLLLLGFLLRKPIVEFFGVEPVVKKRALGVGIGIGIVFILFAVVMTL